MQFNQYLADRLRQVLLDGKWIANTNIKAQITDTAWHEALQQVGNLNSIAALTFHITYYLNPHFALENLLRPKMASK